MPRSGNEGKNECKNNDIKTELKTIQNELSKGKELIDLDKKEIKEIINNPFSKSHYVLGIRNNDDKLIEDNELKWKRRYKCSICGRKYTYSNCKVHKNTSYCQKFKKINDKWKDVILNN